MQTSELQQNSQFIEYQYDYGRLKEIHYPEHPENNVTYYYDNAGRIGFREDGVGSEELLYDELGNVKRSYRRVLVPTENYVYFFETRHKYDSFGKIQHIIYPDQDSVAYNYLPTGELCAVVHKPTGTGSSLQTIVSNIEYDEYGHKVHQSYGNQVETDYSYSPLRQWMTQLETRLPGSGPNIQELYYKYDYVGNITQIDQQAGAWGSIGGPYTNDYTYDHQYRLLAATETSSSTFNVDFSASYSPAGRLGHDFCASNNVNKQLTYGYDIDGLTHQPRVIYDNETEQSYDLFWNANGNLAQIMNCKQEQVRFHIWDDVNRLLSVIGPNKAGFYGYNGNGERIWKLMGTCQNSHQNGGDYTCSAFLDDAVLYPNPYITITPQGYTKHYYLGSERIAMTMGEGGWNYVSRPLSEDEIKINKAYFEHFLMLPCDKYSLTKNEDIEHHDWGELQYSCGAKCLNLSVSSQHDLLYNCISSYQQPTGRSESTFFTHSDHLGSASWISDEMTHPIQYIHYAPYGEILANQNEIGITHDERYKFIGKERDAESGYYYYGARFLAQQLGIWLSVDPLADKYPGISPYAYCNWNPIKFVDSEGTHPLVAAALAVVAPEIVAATALVGAVIYYNLAHQEERNNTSSWEGNKPFSEVRDTRVGLEWQNRQDRKAKRASELQEMEHQQFLQDNLPDPSPDPNKGKDPKGDINRVKKGTVIALAVGYAAAIIDNFKENTTPKVEIKDETTQDNENATIKPLKE